MYALAFGSTIWEFTVRPEAVEVSYTARTAVTPTLSAAYLDHFGPGVGAVNLSGTTGWGKGGRNSRQNGVAALRQLVELYKSYLITAAAAPDPMTIRMTFADAYTGNSFLVVPDASGLRTQQNKSSPLLVRFSLTLIVLRDLSGGRASGNEIAIGSLIGSLGDTAGLASSYADLSSSYLSNSLALGGTPQFYEVQSGDTLAGIATRFGVGEQALRDANGIRFAGRINPGLILTIPTR